MTFTSSSTWGNKHFHDPAGEFAIGGNSCCPLGHSLRKPDQEHDQDNFLAARQTTEPVQNAGRMFAGSCIDHGSVTTQYLTRCMVRQADCYLNSIDKRRWGKKQKGLFQRYTVVSQETVVCPWLCAYSLRLT
jgi:hypothetical protein